MQRSQGVKGWGPAPGLASGFVEFGSCGFGLLRDFRLGMLLPSNPKPSALNLNHSRHVSGPVTLLPGCYRDREGKNFTGDAHQFAHPRTCQVLGL